MQIIGKRLAGAAALGALVLALGAPAHAQSAKPDMPGAHHPPGAGPGMGPPGGRPGMQGSMPMMQDQMPMMGGMMGGMMGEMMQGMMGGMMSGGLSPMMLHHTEGTLAFMKAELQITSAQETLWTAFADATRAAVKKMPAPAPLPAAWPERLEAREKALEAQLDVLKTYRPAATALYAALTPEQKKKADDLGVGGRMGMRMRM